MSFDVYAPCPCGSGKKLKFCCNAIATEMMHIRKLQQNQQMTQALRALEDLESKNPGNPWILTTRATALLEEGNNREARQLLDELLEANPDHLFALALSAAVSLSTDGFEASRPLIHRAFQRCPAVFPDLISNTAMRIASLMYNQQKYLAARQHLAMAMRFSPQEAQQQIFTRLLEFDGNGDIAYPLRGVHVLASYAPENDEHLKEAEKAVRLSNLGCWALSARIFANLIERDSENPPLWQNAGLCHAWDGNEIEAAEALHKAAELYEDRETAVECETLAQLLDHNNSDDRLNVESLQYEVESVGKLLTLLNEQERLARIPVQPEDEEEDDEDVPHPAAIYNVLDRTQPEYDGKKPFTLETVPSVLAEIAVFDHNPLEEEPARAFVSGIEGDDLQRAKSVFEEAAGEQIKPAEEADRVRTLESMPRDFHPLHWNWNFPAKTPMRQRKELERQQWEHLVRDVWVNTPLQGLQGRTPLEAAENDSNKVSLCAAVMVLDSYTDRNRYVLDVEGLFDRLNLAPPAPLKVTPQTPLNALSTMQMHRLPIAELSDEHLAVTLNRALLIHHNDFLYKVLLEVLKRPACLEKIDCDRAYYTLADLCRERFLREEALNWLSRGMEASESSEHAFEKKLQWKMREMAFRLDDPEDPELRPLLKHLWDYYGTKLPQLRTYLSTVVDAYDLEPPWDAGQGETEATPDEGIWTPGTEAGSTSGPGDKKLWLPGQD